MSEFPQLSTEVASNEKTATIKTTMGELKVKLFPEIAPKAVENFVKLAESGYYNGIIFHRVIPDFMIQGETQLEPVWVEKVFGELLLKMNSQIKLSTLKELFQWLMQVLIQMEVNSLLYQLLKHQQTW